MTSDRSLLVNIRKVKEPITISLADHDTALIAIEAGDMSVSIADEGAKSGTVHNVLLMPNLRYNLPSVGRIESSGGEISIQAGQGRIYITGQLIGIAKRKGNLYWLEMTSTLATANVLAHAVKDIELWHRRVVLGM